MWRSLWTSVDRFSLQRFRYLAKELEKINVANKLNREFIVDILRSIVEIVTYGDKHDPSIFDCFMEYQILAEFLRVLKISRNSSIEAPLLHYLSIMIQNLACEHAIYYCLSNEYINNIILHQYAFDEGDLAHYYVSFLRTVSGKLNRDTMCLLVKVKEGVVISFPLYSEALKFAHHEEKMIQIAVRSLTLNIYNSCDDMVYTFITTPPASEYFSDLILNLREQCLNLEALVTTAKDTYSCEMRKELLPETDKVLDDLYYCNDILRIGEYRLSTLLVQNLLRSLFLPMLLPSLQLSHTVGSNVSAITSLYIVCRLLQIVEGKELVNSVAVALLYPYLVLCVRSDTDEGATSGTSPANCFADFLNEMQEMDIAASDPEGAENIDKANLFWHLSELISSNSHFVSLSMDAIQNKRGGILSLIFSENQSLLLASLMFLIVLSENEDLDCLLSSSVGFTEKKMGMEQRMPSDISHLNAMDGNILARHMPQILTALLKVLVNDPPFSIPMLWNTGWILQKLLKYQEKKLTDHDICLFKISTKQSAERLLKELNGCWFDYIPVTLENEWENCKKALEESSQSKDPFFVLELSLHKHIQDGVSSSLAWQRMVDTVQVFVLHHLLDAFIFERDSIENPFQQLRCTSVGDSGITNGIDALSATYGMHLSLGSGIPSKIAFSRREQRDVYLIPLSKGISGKLFLAEKLPFHTDQGAVIAIAPLAGLNPKKDDTHPSWLHLRIRESDPRLHASKTSGYHTNASDQVADGRWTLGFPNAEACEAAVSLILKETSKQRSAVESLLAPLLQHYSLENLPDNQGE